MKFKLLPALTAVLAALFGGCGLLLGEGSYSASNGTWQLKAENPIISYDYGKQFSPLDDLKVVQRNTVSGNEVYIPNKKCKFTLDDGGEKTTLNPPDFLKTYTFYAKTKIKIEYNGRSYEYSVNVNSGGNIPTGNGDGDNDEDGQGIIVEGPI